MRRGILFAAAIDDFYRVQTVAGWIGTVGVAGTRKIALDMLLLLLLLMMLRVVMLPLLLL